MKQLIQILILFFLLISSSFSFSQTDVKCFDDGAKGPEEGEKMYRDQDRDHYGTGELVCVFWYDDFKDFSFKNGDCNDNNKEIYPKAWYIDNDGDRFAAITALRITKCLNTSLSYFTDSSGIKWSTEKTDCDDNDANIHAERIYYRDSDDDGLGNPNDSKSYCNSTVPTGYATNNRDCDDSTATIGGETVWYQDQDGDGLGDSNSSTLKQCNQPIKYVGNADDRCPNKSGSENNFGCPEGENPAEPYNTVQTIAYNIKGNTIANTKAYFDDLGKSTQTQTWDLKKNKVWMSQVLYDEQGRPAFSTLSSPIRNNTSSFLYKDDFIKKENGVSNFTTADFTTGNIENPATVGTQQNTLGWYYSDANTDEPFQDKTDRPYSRTIFSELNPGKVLYVIGGNKPDGEWKHNYSFTLPAAQELYYAYGYSHFRIPADAIGDPYNMQVIKLKATKTIRHDVYGNESVIFTDTDGKNLASARSGGNKKYEIISTINKGQEYVDIHLPKGCENTLSYLGNINYYRVYDLKTDKEVSDKNNLSAGFYRVMYIISNKNRTLTTINTSNNTLNTNAIAGVKYKVNYYDYSLNYYDNAGRLNSSLQPLGFNNACLDGLSETVNHNQNLISEFSYNSLGQLLTTTSPDEGTADFKYREDGQIRFSQNSKQAANNYYSYTNYDEFGRPEESGVAVGTFTTLNGDTSTVTGNKEQHFTEYDFLSDSSELISLIGNTDYHNPSFLAGNVAKTWNKNDQNGPTISATYYSYDLYGRVQWMLQNIPGLGVKTIDYEYDPITSQVLKVIYQKHVSSELFVHKYTYNIAQELVRVETSTDNSTFTTHAAYSYYETGALKRVELADGIQGIDYVYNLAGQLKAINHPNLNSSANNPNNDTNDLFGMTLDYYNGDYQRSTDFSLLTSGTNQYNGNIKGMTWNTKTAAEANNPFQYSYQYNKNNWLTEANFNANGNVQPNTTPEDLVLNTAITAPMNAEATHSITLKPGFKATNNFSAKIVAASTTNDPFSSEDYKVHGITYDANGNIQTLNRNKNTEEINGFTSNKMDELSYHYKTDKPNQLKRVGDAFNKNTKANDIKDQATENNYIYNSIGQLTENKDENVRYEYNASGLVTKVYYNNYLKVQFYYNDKGYRTKKVGYQDNSSTKDKTTYYVLDAAGSPLAIYEDQQQVELPIYGASRLGVYKKASNTSVYQLTDHLGNVRAVIAKEASGNQSNIKTIFNDDLESSTGWDSTGALYGTSATLSTEHAKSGTHSVKIVNPNYNQYQYAHSNSWIPINNEITTDYIFSGWFYSTGPRVRFVFFMNENEETAYYTDTESSAVSSSRNQWEYIEKRVSVPPNIDKINFRIGAFGGGYDSAGTVWYDDLKIEEIKTGATLVSATDYYSGGMVMPGRMIRNGQAYRYGYQGEFAETDEETGKPAFQLRIYDPRINRWMSPDPYGQFASPYMAMDNRWNMSIDPTGGCTVGVDCPEDFDWMGSGTVVLDEIVLGGNGEFSAGIPYETSGLDFRSLENMFSNVNLGNIRPAKYDWTDKWSESENPLINISYDMVNSPWISIQALNPFDDQSQNIDGSGSYGGEFRDDSVLGFVSIATAGYGQYASSIKKLKSSPKLYNSFAKKTKGLFKGTNHNKLRSAAYKEMVKNHNYTVKFVKGVDNVLSSIDKAITFFDYVINKE